MLFKQSVDQTVKSVKNNSLRLGNNEPYFIEDKIVSAICKANRIIIKENEEGRHN